MFLARGMAFVLSIDSIPINHPFYATLKSFYYKLPGGGRLTLIGGLMLLVFAVGILHRPPHPLRHQRLRARRRCADRAALMGVPVGRTTITDLCAVGLSRGAFGHRFFALHLSRLFARDRRRRTRRDRRGGDRRHASDRRRRLCCRHLDRRPDPGADPDLHHLRRLAVELVDEDSDRCFAVCLHSDAKGHPVRCRARTKGMPEEGDGPMRKGLFETVITGAKTRTSHAQVVDELGQSHCRGRVPRRLHPARRLRAGDALQGVAHCAARSDEDAGGQGPDRPARPHRHAGHAKNAVEPVRQRCADLALPASASTRSSSITSARSGWRSSRIAAALAAGQRHGRRNQPA